MPSLPTPPADRLAAAYAAVDAEVHRFDRDRWLAGLYAPEAARRHLYALYAFSLEIGRIRERVSDPLPGEIRARWWADMLCGARGGEGESHPVAAAVADTVQRFHLPVAALERLIEARIFDLYDDPMPDLAALEAYCDDTSGTLVRLAAQVLAEGHAPGVDEISRQAGVAHGLMQLLRALPAHAATGQVFLPADLLARHGVERADILAGRFGPGLAAALATVRGRAREALAATRRLVGTVPPELAPAFLPAALVDLCLSRMERPGYDPFRTPVDSAQWRRQLRLWRAAGRARRAAHRVWHRP